MRLGSHRVHRLAAVAGLTAAAWATVMPAHAAVTGPCDGSVTIAGVTYGPANDTPRDPIVVPAGVGATASWEGSTSTPITDHEGVLRLAIGPGSVPIASWGGENADRQTRASGEEDIDAILAELPTAIVGLFELSGRHAGTGGTCEGSVMVRIDGNPLTTPIGAASTVGLLAGLAGIGVAARGRPPIPNADTTPATDAEGAR